MAGYRSSPEAPDSTSGPPWTAWSSRAASRPTTPLRDSYQRYADENGRAALHALLAERDAASAAVIHPNNTRRVIRALEMADEGVSYAEQAAGFSTEESLYDVRYVGLTMEREALYERIDSRVDAMVGAGLLGEVEELLGAGFRDALTATQAIGYKEFVPVIEDGADAGDGDRSGQAGVPALRETPAHVVRLRPSHRVDRRDRADGGRHGGGRA